MFLFKNALICIVLASTIVRDNWWRLPITCVILRAEIWKEWVRTCWIFAWVIANFVILHVCIKPNLKRRMSKILWSQRHMRHDVFVMDDSSYDLNFLCQKFYEILIPYSGTSEAMKFLYISKLKLELDSGYLSYRCS